MTGVSAPVQVVRPPTVLVAAAAVALVLSAALLAMRSFEASLVGYLLAPLVVTILVCFYRYRDARASQNPMYASLPKQMRIATWLVVLSFVIGLAHAWIIATVIAKAMAS